jgi:hypothetical protein
MATQTDVRRIALSLPDTREEENHFAFSVLSGRKYKGFAWVWMERAVPRKPRAPCPDVLAVRVANLDAKEVLLMADARAFFTEPHYDGYPAVLVRLKEIRVPELRALLIDAWIVQAPAALHAKLGKRRVVRRVAFEQGPSRPRLRPKPSRTSQDTE